MAVNAGSGSRPRATLADVGRQDSGESNGKPVTKPSTFKITSVVYAEKGSSLDEHMSFNDEEEESNVDESINLVDIESNADSPLNFHIEAAKRSDRVDSTSRFRVVKLQNRDPYLMGRWRVIDYISDAEFSHNKIGDINLLKGSESSNSSRASSTHYVPGVDDPLRNPLSIHAHGLHSVDSNFPVSMVNGNPHEADAVNSGVTVDVSASNITSVSAQIPNQNAVSNQTVHLQQTTPSEPTRNTQIPIATPSDIIPLDEPSTIYRARPVTTLADALGTIAVDAGDGEKPEDDAAASGVAIDNKIEQAMDLVKSHLMLAVREEIEDLKLQIQRLLEHNAQLEQENKILRQAASQETLAQLALLNRQHNAS